MNADSPKGLTDTDLAHLRRAVELAEAALAAGDEPFGSVLVDDAGAVRFEDHNHVAAGDTLAHPEIAAARWAIANLGADERARATVYTSGEHCPMCAAAHAWAGLGRIVYATSSEQLARWCEEWGVAAGPVAPLPIRRVAPGLEVIGPVEELVGVVRELQRQRFAAQPQEVRTRPSASQADEDVRSW